METAAANQPKIRLCSRPVIKAKPGTVAWGAAGARMPFAVCSVGSCKGSVLHAALRWRGRAGTGSAACARVYAVKRYGHGAEIRLEHHPAFLSGNSGTVWGIRTVQRAPTLVAGGRTLGRAQENQSPRVGGSRVAGSGGPCVGNTEAPRAQQNVKMPVVRQRKRRNSAVVGGGKARR